MKKTSILLIATAFVLMLSACAKVDYDKANEKTADMTDYRMTISTIVTIEDATDIRQSAINQNVSVNNKGKSDMIYSVQTSATSTDVTAGKVVTEENSYIFYNNSYYYTYPGVRYKSATAFDMALANIENLSNVITFSEDEMINPERESADGGNVATFLVNYEDTSAFVKAILENAAANFDGVTFSPEDIGASCTVKDGAVTARELYICYAAATGERITVEIYVDYESAEAVEVPDESKYVNIEG